MRIRIRFCDAVVMAAVLAAAMIYCGRLDLSRKEAFRCAFEADSVTEICGRLESSPARSGLSERGYTASFAPREARAAAGASSCRGSVRVILPASQVEALYPGRLFSRSRNPLAQDALFESGAQLRLRGRMAEGESAGERIFIAREAESLGFGQDAFGRLCEFRARLRLAFRRLMYRWGRAGALLLALVSGSREYLPPELLAAFRGAGLSHILALSGMHLSFFGGAARKLGSAAQLAVSLLFVCFAGLSPSLFRALLCALLATAASARLVKSVRGVNVLSLAFLIHVFAFPSDAGTAAFMLSYSAMLGIVLFSQSFERLFLRWIPPIAAKSLAASVSAQVLAAPVGFALFGAFNPLCVFASVAVSPLVCAFMAGGATFAALSLAAPFLLVPFGAIMNCLYVAIEFLAGIFARL